MSGDISDISLWLGKTSASSLSVASTGNVTLNNNSNSNISHTPSTYTGGVGYQGSSGGFFSVMQTTFNNLNLTIDGGVLYYFGIAAQGQEGWYGHASNNALDGVTSEGADGLYRVFNALGVLTSTFDSGASNCDPNGTTSCGWDKSSEINVQITGQQVAVPEPASFALIAVGLFGVGAAHRRRQRAL